MLNKSVDFDRNIFAKNKQRRKHVMVFAHQDDEIGCAGIIQKTGDGKYIWLTNGDGLAINKGANPAKYAKERSKESMKAMNFLGKSRKQIVELGYSEIKIYEMFEEVAKEDRKALEYFGKMAERVYREVKKNNPKVIWTLAYQGGHPGHDLAHLCASYARRRIEAEENRKIELMAIPSYDYSLLPPFFYAFIFRPFQGRLICKVKLNKKELEMKLKCLEVYPSQAKIFSQFKLFLNILGKFWAILGKGFNYMDFASSERFEIVSRAENTLKNPHFLPFMSYLPYKESFAKTIKPIARYLRDM